MLKFLVNFVIERGKTKERLEFGPFKLKMDGIVLDCFSF